MSENCVRSKHPNVYTFRTSREMLNLLLFISRKQARFKCDVLEDAVREYYENHFDDDYIYGIGTRRVNEV